jgi:hypothetical protein
MRPRPVRILAFVQTYLARSASWRLETRRIRAAPWLRIGGTISLILPSIVKTELRPRKPQWGQVRSQQAARARLIDIGGANNA